MSAAYAAVGMAAKHNTAHIAATVFLLTCVSEFMVQLLSIILDSGYLSSEKMKLFPGLIDSRLIHGYASTVSGEIGQGGGKHTLTK